MTSKWNTNTYPAAAMSDDADDGMTAVLNGIDTAITRYSGTGDPSTGAPAAWGASQVGALWFDTTSADTVAVKQWQQISGTPTYGWRTLYTPKLIWLTTPVDALAAASSAVDVAYTDVACATVLDSDVQDAVNRPLVRMLCVRVYAKCTGAIPAGDKAYVAVREKGSTNEIRVHAQVPGKPVYHQVWIGLDSNEKFQYAVDTDGGGITMDYEIKIMGAIELM